MDKKEIFALAVKNHQKNNLQVAKNLYIKTLEIDPDNTNAYNNLGLVFGKLEEFQKAIDCYEKAIQINPKSASIYNNLGVVYEKLKKLDKAINCYQKSTQVQLHAQVLNRHSWEPLLKLGSRISNLRIRIAVNRREALRASAGIF